MSADDRIPDHHIPDHHIPDHHIPDHHIPDHRVQDMRAPGTPTHVDLDIEVDATSLYTLRAAVAAHATELGMSDRQLDKLLVVATELATNVIRHSGGSGRLRLWRSGDDLVCQVDDAGPGIPDPERVGIRPVPLGAAGGRGLWIVRQLCDQVSIAADDHGTTIVVTIGT